MGTLQCCDGLGALLSQLHIVGCLRGSCGLRALDEYKGNSAVLVYSSKLIMISDVVGINQCLLLRST